MGKRGFTLVELLVVIAVIAILGAMLFPVLMEAKETAQMSTCSSNLKQLGCAITQYFEDNNGFGMPQSPPAYENPWVLCANPLKRYLGQATIEVRSGSPVERPKKLWICPGDVDRGGEERPYWWHWGSSYLYPGPTAYLSGTEKRQKLNTYARKPSLWRNHKRDVLLADYWYDFHSGRKVPHNFDISTGLQRPAWVDELDVKSNNVLFLDLHVMPVTPSELSTYVSMTIYDDNPYYKPAYRMDWSTLPAPPPPAP